MNPEKAAERVLVIPESHFRKVGFFQGFRPFDPDYLGKLLDPTFFSFRPRGEVETDPRFKQLIPYVLLSFKDRIFFYRRGTSGTETRLQSLRSVGIGGHISDEDGSMIDAYETGMLRELHEEVAIPEIVQQHYLGFIFDDRTPVGSVHLGIVHRFDLAGDTVHPRETAIAETGFATIGSLLRERDSFETWSQFALEEVARCHGS